MFYFDEPTEGLAEKETGMTAEAVKLFKKHGLTIIVVEHDLKFIKQIAEKLRSCTRVVFFMRVIYSLPSTMLR